MTDEAVKLLRRIANAKQGSAEYVKAMDDIDAYLSAPAEQAPAPLPADAPPVHKTGLFTNNEQAPKMDAAPARDALVDRLNEAADELIRWHDSEETTAALMRSCRRPRPT